ncbi:MAG TPA: glycosyltransferase family 39 protein, partial [Acidimicrobiales bacterium]|nr:glycosyltransferase family 39 protein [Acidimicrobiales bacterium]
MAASPATASTRPWIEEPARLAGGQQVFHADQGTPCNRFASHHAGYGRTRVRLLVGGSTGNDRGNVSIGTVIDPPLVDVEVPTVVRHGNRLALVRIVLVLAAGLGIALRLWYFFHDALNSDEASVGLAAQHILNGHFNAFYPGQLYGGVEPYLTAALFGVFGQSALMVKLTPVLLSAVAAILMWRIARRLVGDGQIAALAGVLFWVAPVAAVWNSTVERGFRGVTMA